MLQLYRNNAPIETLPLTREISYEHALMSEHKIVVSNLLTPRILNVQIGDYIMYNGIKYTINTVPNYEKVEHTTNHSYNITFEHPIYTAYNKIFMLEGDSEVPFFGTPDDFINLWLENMNSIDPTWTKGQVDVMDEIHLTITDSSCRVALTTFAEQQKMEFFFDGADGKRINLVAKAGIDTDITLQYGKGNGLYSLSRSYVEDKNVVTRVYGIGGNRNLPVGYTKKRLQLSNPLEANIDLYGVIEGQYVNEDIYPTRTGTVTSVTPYDPETKFNKLVDADLPFNIKDQLAPGLTAKISFDNGELAGYEFEITDYNHSTKTITYLTNTDTSTGVSMPNENFQAKVGDNYRLLDIILPQSYVDDALTKLQTETQSYLDESKFPRVAYDLNIDVLHYKRMGYDIQPGDRVRIRDEKLGIDAMIRVNSISYPVAYPEQIWTGMEITLEISDDVVMSTQERVMVQTAKNASNVKKISSATKHAIAASEEIARAAALTQFQRAYYGELAALAGAFVAGNPDLGAVAGISGLEDVLSAIRIWAGASFENRGSAPFRVDQAGNLWATQAIIEGIITALSGTIGFLSVDQDSLTLGEQQDSPSDPWTPGMNVINFYKNYFLYRLNGSTRGQIRELAFNLYNPSTTPNYKEAARTTNNIDNHESNGTGINVAHTFVAENGDINIAIDAKGTVAGSSFVTKKYGLMDLSVSAFNNISIDKNGTSVVVKSSPTNTTAYLPSVSDIQLSAQIGSAEDFAVRMTVIAHYANADDVIVTADYTLYDHNGNVLPYLTLSKGDSCGWIICRESGTTWGQLIAHKFE